MSVLAPRASTQPTTAPVVAGDDDRIVKRSTGLPSGAIRRRRGPGGRTAVEDRADRNDFSGEGAERHAMAAGNPEGGDREGGDDRREHQRARAFESPTVSNSDKCSRRQRRTGNGKRGGDGDAA